MAPRAGDDKVAEVRERATLSEIVSRYVQLRRSGRNFLGLCPFHGEKTPSFSVSDERGFFHCFGCGASGDVFTFLMRMENVTFPEALERLARELGVELPRRPEEARRAEGQERFLRVNAAAADFFQRCLWQERAGATAREYLRRRDISDDTARAFALGYAPPEGLARAIETAKLALADAETLGLVARSQHGPGWYDRFRHRLVFPITDLSGHIIAFGGRVLGEAPEGQPKYLNSPETPLFQKRRSLFGLASARDAIRQADRAIVVEGYIDAIALAQAGIRNVVAPLGTALTTDQLRLLRRFTDRIVVFFDGDAAGARAAARSFEVFAEIGLFADAAFLPEGHDPDSYVREAGPRGVEELLARASGLVDHYLRSLAPGDAPLAARMRAAESVAALVTRIRNPIFAGLFARRAAEYLGLAEEQLLKRARAAAPVDRPSTPGASAPAPAASPPKPRVLARHDAMLIEILLVHPEVRAALPASLGPLLGSDEARALLEQVQAASPEETSALVESLPPDSRSRAARALLGETEIYGDPQRMLIDCIARLEHERREERLYALGREIREAEARGDAETLTRLLGEKQRLSTEAGTNRPRES